MALEVELLSKPDSDDEDPGCYFLQPSSSPYNIAEKLHKANVDLQNSDLNSNKTAKVKFRDELVSFEPDLTDDDVNSIESDHVAEEIVTNIEENVSSDHQIPLSCDFAKEEEICEEFEEEEELVSETEVENPTDVIKIVDDQKKIDSEKDSGKKKKKIKSSNSNKSFRLSEVKCKVHCMENLDSNLSMSIRKLEIHEKSLLNLPPLQLRQRNCCDNNKNQNLPHYNGCRSEYGLDARQLQKRNRYMEMVKQKELARQRLVEEYRRLKMQQNEQVFCQWLKDISRRKDHRFRTTSRTSHETIHSPSVVNVGLSQETDKSKRLRERPKTAGVNEFIPKTKIKVKKRPRTTQSCVYIQIPRDVLEKGIQIGDLLVTNSKTINKKLHILTVS